MNIQDVDSAAPLMHTLPNGMRVVTGRSDGHVTYAGVLTASGSREDPVGKDGLAHFVEHTIFKGTPRRTASQVSNRMELVGGELNAYTTKEEIMLYTTAPVGYESRAAELMADLVENAHFPEDEVSRERGVVDEEINSYRDNASFAVYDEFDELFFKGNELAHNILGYHDTLAGLTGEDARGFLERNFTPGNMVAYMLSPQDPRKSMRVMERCFAGLSRREVERCRVTPTPQPLFDEVRDRGNSQANVVMGAPACAQDSDDRFAWYLLCNMLGGPAMNSRLNSVLRERRGLVYTVESSLALYSDCGIFQIYFGTEPERVDKCAKLVVQEVERLADKLMTDKAFERCKRQICGQLLVGSDNRESVAMTMAKSLLRHGRLLDNADTARKLQALAPHDVLEVARKVADAGFSKLVIK